MSTEVKRYDPINSDGTCGMCIEDADYGAYVEYADYSALKAERERLRAQVSALQSDANSWQSGYDKGREDGAKAAEGWKAQHARDSAELRRLCSERDALRQQLAERDAEIERLRVKLMTIASAEPGRHNIEWAKAMAATGNNEAYAKWREAFDQRDRLAGLLADVKADYTHAIHWEDMHATMKRIDAALAEVKPCLESPAPTT